MLLIMLQQAQHEDIYSLLVFALSLSKGVMLIMPVCSLHPELVEGCHANYVSYTKPIRLSSFSFAASFDAA
jgi:hypothetical protein